MNTDRSGGSESVDALPVGAADVMVSSQGSARAAPAPRKTVRREILLDIVSLSPSRFLRMTYLTTIGPVRFGRGGGASIVTAPPWLFRNGVLSTISRISVRAR